MVQAGEDVLSELAPLLRVRPELQEFCRFGGSWAGQPEPEPEGWAYFHIVTKGSCLLDRPGQETLSLETDDILLLPRGGAHTTRGHAPGRPGKIAVDYVNAIRMKRTVDAEPDTELICGRLQFEQAAENLVIAALPEVIMLRMAEQSLAERFRHLMSGIREELDTPQPGAAAVAANLASALFVMMLRAHLANAAASDGLLKLLGQRMTARAVLAMLHEPARDWTLDELASLAAASRATLVRAFGKAVGMAPLAFLTELRLSLAHQRLAACDDPIARIAETVGYQSEATFSRAFQRRYGIRPGEARRRR